MQTSLERIERGRVGEMTRRGLRALLHAQPDLHVDAECATAREAVVEVERFGSRMLIMDPALPDASGFETCRRLCERLPALHVVMLIARPVERTVVAGVRAGATAILSKRAPLSDIRDTVRAAAAGVARLDGLATAALVEHVRHAGGRLDGDAALTDVERRVLARVVAGRTNKQIGHELTLSETTVKSHLSRAFTKLHVTRRARAAVLFVATAGSAGPTGSGRRTRPRDMRGWSARGPPPGAGRRRKSFACFHGSVAVRPPHLRNIPGCRGGDTRLA